ncbi:MAG: hypothetical protein EXS51_01480 [Candidatus Taylorbacteria bacterium]|nr:hypothetical protein [Candidatus Taylorbacteria bacterium]
MNAQERTHNQKIIDERNKRASTADSRRLAKIMKTDSPNPAEPEGLTRKEPLTERRQEQLKYVGGPTGEELA